MKILIVDDSRFLRQMNERALGKRDIRRLPRWNGDANFVTVVGEVRVLPETLDTTYDRLKRRLHG